MRYSRGFPGSASRIFSDKHQSGTRGRASKAVRSQAEPGNEKNEKRGDRHLPAAGFLGDSAGRSEPVPVFQEAALCTDRTLKIMRSQTFGSQPATMLLRRPEGRHREVRHVDGAASWGRALECDPNDPNPNDPSGANEIVAIFANAGHLRAISRESLEGGQLAGWPSSPPRIGRLR